MVGLGGFHVTTVSNLNPRCIELELGLGFDNYFNCQIPNSTSTQPNMTYVRVDNKMTLVHHPQTTHPPHKLNVRNTSAVTEHILPNFIGNKT